MIISLSYSVKIKCLRKQKIYKNNLSDKEINNIEYTANLNIEAYIASGETLYLSRPRVNAILKYARVL
tara:strand:+ start:1213 stop:1416 length:204 start_codon:yes stop_codon:yes gene_type:complete